MSRDALEERLIGALRRSVEKERFYAERGDGQGNAMADALHIAIGSALERIARDLEATGGR
jgi:hypothetical protein